MLYCYFELDAEFPFAPYPFRFHTGGVHALSEGHVQGFVKSRARDDELLCVRRQVQVRRPVDAGERAERDDRTVSNCLDDRTGRWCRHGRGQWRSGRRRRRRLGGYRL